MEKLPHDALAVPVFEGFPRLRRSLIKLRHTLPSLTQSATMNPNSNNKDSKTSTTSTTTVRQLNWFLPFWKAYCWSNFRVTAMSNLLGFYTLDHKSISHIVITMKLRKKRQKKSLKKTKRTPTNSTACHGNSNAVAWQLLWRKIR